MLGKGVNLKLGEAIKNYLIEKGIKQSFIAEKAGITDVTMSTILSCKRGMNPIEYYRICKALEIPLEYFFSIVDEDDD